MLPVILLLILVVLQVVVVVRDQLRVVHVARAAAREAMVDPDQGSVRRSVARSGVSLEGVVVSLSGERSPGGLLEVDVRARPTRLPVVGHALGNLELRERLVVMVE